MMEQTEHKYWTDSKLWPVADFDIRRADME
jgi:hypothetical protein